MDTLNYNYLLNRFTTNQSTIEVYVYTTLYISSYNDSDIYYALVDHEWEVRVNHNNGLWVEENIVGSVTDSPAYINSNISMSVDHEEEQIYLNLPELIVDYKSWDYSIDFEIVDDHIDIHIYNYDDVEISSEEVMIGGDEVNSQYLTIPKATREDCAIEFFYEDIEPLWELHDYINGYNVGKKEGYINGNNVGQQEGYNNGYNVGQQEGYNNGYNVGYNEGQQNQTALTFGNVISIISDNAANLLKVEILPNFTIGNIIFIPVVFSLIGVIFKFFRR